MNETATPRTKMSAAIVVGLATTMAVGAVGGAALARADAIDTGPSVEARSSGPSLQPSLAETTLDELSEALAEMGLVIEITAAERTETSPPPAEASPDDDPFAGMTDAQIDELSDEEFFAILDAAGVAYEDEWVESDADGWGEAEDADGAFEEEAPLATFSVDGDELDLGDAQPEQVARAQAMWKRWVELIPADQREMVSRFELMDVGYGGAHVYPDDDDPTKWVLGVSLGLADDLDYTLVHEFGHLLTLQGKEVPPGADADGCTTYFTGEGCALTGSTFARFVDAFWPKEMLDQIDRIQGSGDWEAADAFYREHETEFVSDYATTNPGEDLAESFAVFVMNERPGGTSIADQKVQFLWNDPAMVSLRAQIRSNGVHP